MLYKALYTPVGVPYMLLLSIVRLRSSRSQEIEVGMVPVMTIPACQLDYMWNGLKSKNGCCTSQGFLHNLKKEEPLLT